MARIRSIHPGLWTDEAFVELSMAARLLAIGLWNEADDYGVFKWTPKQIKMRLFPADAIAIEPLLEELILQRMVVRLTRAGVHYGAIRNFRKFQRPNRPSSPIVEIDAEIAAIVAIGPNETPPIPPNGSGFTEGSVSAPGGLSAPSVRAPSARASESSSELFLERSGKKNNSDRDDGKIAHGPWARDFADDDKRRVAQLERQVRTLYPPPEAERLITASRGETIRNREGWLGSQVAKARAEHPPPPKQTAKELEIERLRAEFGWAAP